MKFYNVYDTFDKDKMIVECGKTSEISDALGCPAWAVSQSGYNGLLLMRRYLVEEAVDGAFFRKFGIHAEDYDQAMIEFREKVSKR